MVKIADIMTPIEVHWMMGGYYDVVIIPIGCVIGSNHMGVGLNLDRDIADGICHGQFDR